MRKHIQAAVIASILGASAAFALIGSNSEVFVGNHFDSQNGYSVNGVDVINSSGNVVASSAIVGASGTVLQGSGGTSSSFTATPTLGVAGTTTGKLLVAGSTSGTVTVQPSAAAGTYNFNLPTSAGTSGQPLLSGGGGSTAQSYGTLGVAAGGSGLVQAASQQVTTTGNAIGAGACEAQTGVTITGVTTTSACMASVPTALPATWRTGIAMTVVVTANTATLNLCNGTAGSITPAAQAVNIKCIL